MLSVNLSPKGITLSCLLCIFFCCLGSFNIKYFITFNFVIRYRFTKCVYVCFSTGLCFKISTTTNRSWRLTVVFWVWPASRSHSRPSGFKFLSWKTPQTSRGTRWNIILLAVIVTMFYNYNLDYLLDPNKNTFVDVPSLQLFSLHFRRCTRKQPRTRFGRRWPRFKTILTCTSELRSPCQRDVDPDFGLRSIK